MGGEGVDQLLAGQFHLRHQQVSFVAMCRLGKEPIQCSKVHG